MERNYKVYIKVDEILKCKRENGFYLVPDEILHLKVVKGNWIETDDITKILKENAGKKILTKVINNKFYYKIKD